MLYFTSEWLPNLYLSITSLFFTQSPNSPPRLLLVSSEEVRLSEMDSGGLIGACQLQEERCTQDSARNSAGGCLDGKGCLQMGKALRTLLRGLAQGSSQP